MAIVINDEIPAKSNFFSYLKSEKRLLIIASFLFAIIFALLKFCYPYPDFFNDSFSYVEDAFRRPEIGYRPMGYSDFLIMVHAITTSATIVVIFQYSLHFISTLFCFFSCDYLFAIPGKLKTIAFILVVFNPILILQTNLISSDSIFCSLSIIWFTLCLWIIKKQNWWVMILQAAFLLLCFQIRYTAMFFPIISVVLFILCKGKIIYKMAGIVISAGVIFFYVQYQENLTEKIDNVRLFSGFSGWQIANNVLCYYKKLDIRQDDLPPGEPRIVDRFVKKFIGRVYIDDYVGTQYIWNVNSPLKIYIFARSNFWGDTYFYDWLTCSETFSEYGWAIIKHDPVAYIRYYMFPNSVNFLYPVPQELANYNVEDLEIPPLVKTWFRLDFDHLDCRFPNLQKYIVYMYPAITFLINLVNFLVIVVLLTAWRKIDKDTLRLVLTWGIFYLSFMLFCVFSTIVLLRYVDLIFIIGIIMPFVLLPKYPASSLKKFS